jgi:hypothetical protein
MSEPAQSKESSRESDEPEQKSPDESEEFIAVRDIRLLLDYLDRSCHNWFLAQFEGALARAAATAEPPLKSYHDFLSRLTKIEKNIRAPAASSTDSKELLFLRWARNFLAIAAAPATLDSIRTTREFIDERARLAVFPWWKVWQRGKANVSAKSVDLGAKWMATSVRRLERWLIVTTIFTVLISAYAMVGKYISDQKTDALHRFQKASEVLWADEALAWQMQSTGEPESAFYSPCSAKRGYPAVNRASAQLDSAPEVYRSAAGTAGATADVAAVAAAVQVAQKLLRDCEELRREGYHLMAEDIRLRSWESILIGGQEESIWAKVIGRIAWPVLGWSNDTVKQVAEGVDPAYCDNLKSDNNAAEGQACKQAVLGIVQGTGSMSSAILGCITLYLVPALYSLIGAGAATMRYLRRRVETSTLVVIDRPRISYNLILGCAFGAIIGLFSRYFGAESNIGPAAVALLAGFNVPAVFSFLGELSNRVFGIVEAGGEAAAAKGSRAGPAGAATAGGA